MVDDQHDDADDRKPRSLPVSVPTLSAYATVRGVPLLRAEKTWREVADRGLEIVICIGHIVGVVMLVVDHLF